MTARPALAEAVAAGADDSFGLAAETAQLVAAAWRRGLTPERQLTVSEWADANRLMPSTTAEPGPWRTGRVPYLREIMDALSTSSPVDEVVFMKGTQVGGTECALNAVGYWVDHSPGVILLVWPSLDMVRKNSRIRIDPLLEGTPAIRKKIVPARAKDPGNTVSQKDFDGGSLVMTGANSATGLRSLPARFLVCDEVDAFPADADGEGDPVTLAKKRTSTFRGRRKVLLISTPTEKGASRIEDAYDASDRRRYFVPCPHCGEMQPLTWDGLRWPEGEPSRAFYVCQASACGGIMEEGHKPAMLAGGEWRALAPGRGKAAGFHLSALYSPFESWGECVKQHLEAGNDGFKRKVFTNTVLAETYEDRADEPLEAAAFIDRLEDFGERLPEGVAVLVAGVDVQGDRLALEIVGWGRGEESWSVEYTELWGDPARPDVWRDLDHELARTFDHPRYGPMPIRAACVDSGGHHTQTVYAFSRERLERSVWAIKGRGGPGVPVWPTRPPKRRDGKFRPFIIGVDAAKELIIGRLRLEVPGAGFSHFPAGRDLEFFRMLTAEKVTKRYHRGSPIREWTKEKSARNEALDCRVYAYAALCGLTARGFRLDDEARRIAGMPLREPAGTSAPIAAPARPRVSRSAFMQRGRR
ncbi:phage terminase large subunit family protein [Salinarimonas chemoclinalis]|uniref:phage terminase large subunit family protein n=1 Tax=Salinarimonas chemoclinalis TaxID=3241599 RepID=UPI00355803BF